MLHLMQFRLMENPVVGAVVLGAVQEEAVTSGACGERVCSEQSPALCERICHPVAEDEATAWRRLPVGVEAIWRMNAPEDEGDIGSDGIVKERDVVDGLAQGPFAGMDLLAAAEQ